MEGGRTNRGNRSVEFFLYDGIERSCNLRRHINETLTENPRDARNVRNFVRTQMFFKQIEKSWRAHLLVTFRMQKAKQCPFPSGLLKMTAERAKTLLSEFTMLRSRSVSRANGSLSPSSTFTTEPISDWERICDAIDPRSNPPTSTPGNKMARNCLTAWKSDSETLKKSKSTSMD